MAVRRGLGIIVCGVFSSIIILGCGENEKISLDTQPTPIEQTSEAPSQPTPVEQTCEAPSQPTSASTESDSKYQRGSKGVGDPYFPNLGNGGYDVQRYLIDIEWDPLNEILSGWTTIEAETTENLSSFNVDLNPNMIVSEVTVNGDQACFIREGTEVTVQPVNNLSVGSNFEARFSYTGKPGLVQLENAPFAGGWFSEPWTQENGSICMNCILYVLGEPSSSMAWHPVNDHPSDRAQFRIEIATVLDDVIPKMFSDWEFITNGYLISKEKTTDSSNSEITTWIYETRYPQAPYLTVLAYGPFIESDAEDLGDVQLRHWADTERIYPGDYFEFGKETIGFDYDSMFEVFTNLFGPYPFDTYGYLVLGDPLGLALETQTLSIFGVNTWQAPFIHVHELAHQWFGNYITVDNWSEIWLNEGFATYSEYLYEEATTPEYDIFLEMRYLALMGDSYDVPPGDPGPEDLFHPSVYNRSALTLHALRMTIGDDAFFTSIRKYVDDFGGTSVTTTDFIQIVESVSGADLEDFFARWLYDTEMPDLPCMGFRPCGE